MRDKGMKVIIISSQGPEIDQIDLDDNLIYEKIEISRQISPVNDMVTLVHLIRIFRKYRFDIVHSTTPKAGLLSAIAAFLVRVPIRLHTWTGQPWVTQTGIKKVLTMLSDRLIGFLNTKCYADSPSQKEFLIQKKIIPARKIKVIHKGSISGIDLERFNPDRITNEYKQSIRKNIGLPQESKIITFIGRVNRDKGIIELIQAFKKTAAMGYHIDLLIIGPMDQDSEGQDFEKMLEYIKGCDRIHYLGYKKNPEKYLSISDIYCLPSYREGFGSTVIEAAAMGVPAIGTKINGLVDAIEDGQTGLLVPLKSVDDLAKGFIQLLDHPEMMSRMGNQAKQRCRENFDKNKINKMVWKDYLRLLTR